MKVTMYLPDTAHVLVATTVFDPIDAPMMEICATCTLKPQDGNVVIRNNTEKGDFEILTAEEFEEEYEQ